jgi:hypothetical protein
MAYEKTLEMTRDGVLGPPRLTLPIGDPRPMTLNLLISAAIFCFIFSSASCETKTSGLLPMTHL